jgi:hypothetical protein
MGGAAPQSAPPAGSGDPTVEDVARDLNQARDMGELETVWRRRTTAPFRPQLQPLLDQRKAALAPTAPQPASPGGYDGV